MIRTWLTIALVLIGAHSAAAEIAPSDIKFEVASMRRFYLFEFINSTELSASKISDGAVFSQLKEDLKLHNKSSLVRLEEHDAEMFQLVSPVIAQCGENFACRLSSFQSISMRTNKWYDGYVVVRAQKSRSGCKVDLEVYIMKDRVRHRSEQTACGGPEILQAVRSQAKSIFENLIQKEDVSGVEITFGHVDAPVKAKLWVSPGDEESLSLLKELREGWAKKNEKKIHVTLRFVSDHAVVEAAYCALYLGNLNGYWKTSVLESIPTGANTSDWADKLAVKIGVDRKKMQYCMIEKLFDAKVMDDYQEIYQKLARPNLPVLTTDNSILEKATLESLEKLAAGIVAAPQSAARFNRQVIQIE